MEWQQLEYFHAVAQVEHFTRAAEMLSIAQPTLSRSISKLENELGVPLFERQGRRVALSRYGRMFYRRTSNVLAEMSEAKREIANLVNPDHGHVAVAFLKSLGASPFPSLVRSFLEYYPNIKFQLVQDATSVMLNQLESGHIDFCLSSTTETRRGIQWTHLWTEQLLAFVPDEHPLASRKIVTLADLANERFIALKQGYGVRTIMDDVFSQAGLQPNIAFEGDELVTVLGFVRANLGIAFLPRIKGVDMSGIVSLTIDFPGCKRDIGIAWMQDRYLSPVARRFQQFVIEYYVGSSPERSDVSLGAVPT